MGIKLLSLLQMIPCCYNFITSNISCIPLLKTTDTTCSSTVGNGRTIKLIKSDGKLKVYHKPIHVSLLMLEYPDHLVCHSESFIIGKKIPHLSGNEKLQLGHNYFLLPLAIFQVVLSFVAIASFAKNGSVVKSCIQALYPEKTKEGLLQLRVKEEFISGLEEEDTPAADDDAITEPKISICSTKELQKDYKNLVLYSRRQWQPKLNTIEEVVREPKNKFAHSSSFATMVHHHHKSTCISAKKKKVKKNISRSISF